MPVPTVYTEATLAAFMKDTLGEVADLLGWTASGYAVDSFRPMVEDALVAYGVGTIENALNITKLRAAAKVAAWSGAMTALVTRYDFQSEQQSFSRSQMAKTAKEMLNRAESEAASVGVLPGWSVESSHLAFVLDPYAPTTGEEVA